MPRYLRNLIIALVVIAVLIGLDFVFQGRMLNPYFVRILMLSGIAITLAVSLNLINGFTGQFSIGHAGFMAVGAYSSAYFSVNYGVNLANSLGGGTVGWVVALLVSTLIGAFFAGHRSQRPRVVRGRAVEGIRHRRMVRRRDTRL